MSESKRSIKKPKTSTPLEASEVLSPAIAAPEAAASERCGRFLLDERRQREICAIVAVGCSQRTAAMYLGCSPSAISTLKQRNAVFRNAMLHSQAQHELALVRRIQEAAASPNGWRAAAWLLSRSYPERYAARAAETVTPQQIEDSLEFFAAQVAREVKDAKARSRIRISLRKATRKIVFDIRRRNAE